MRSYYFLTLLSFPSIIFPTNESELFLYIWHNIMKRKWVPYLLQFFHKRIKSEHFFGNSLFYTLYSPIYSFFLEKSNISDSLLQKFDFSEIFLFLFISSNYSSKLILSKGSFFCEWYDKLLVYNIMNTGFSRHESLISWTI